MVSERTGGDHRLELETLLNAPVSEHARTNAITSQVAYEWRRS